MEKIKEVILFDDNECIDYGNNFINFNGLSCMSKTWEAVSSSNDPQIILYNNSVSPLNSQDFRFIKFSLFVNRFVQGQLIWWLSDGRWQTSNNFNIYEGWHEYCFDMASIPTRGKSFGSGIGWEGLIPTLRFDPGDERSVTVKIKDVKLTSIPQNMVTYVQKEITVDIINNFNSMPFLIYAEISTKCNLRCRMCGRYSYKIPASQEKFMKREVFLKLTKLFTPAARLELFGRGESLLHPGLLYFLKLSREKQINVEFTTNGLLLTREIAQAMVENNQMNITFSCSAGSPQTYKKIHGVDAWDKFWDNIAMLNDFKRKHLSSQDGLDVKSVRPSINLEFVSQLSNISELPGLLRRAISYNAVGLVVVDLVAHSDMMEKERMNIPENMPLADKYYKQTLEVYEDIITSSNSFFDLRLPGSYLQSNKESSPVPQKQTFSRANEFSGIKSAVGTDNICLEPWKTFYVRFDGTVTPCCITGRILGDLNKNTAEEIWGGELYRKFRQRMKGENKPYECRHCHFLSGPKRYDTKLDKPDNYEEL